jgi:hypothetical protein
MRAADMGIADRCDRDRRTMPMIARDLYALDYEKIWLNEPRIYVEPKASLEQSYRDKRNPPRARTKFIPTFEQPNARP